MAVELSCNGIVVRRWTEETAFTLKVETVEGKADLLKRLREIQNLRDQEPPNYYRR